MIDSIFQDRVGSLLDDVRTLFHRSVNLQEEELDLEKINNENTTKLLD